MEKMREDSIEFDCGFMKVLGSEEFLFHSPCDNNLVSLSSTSCNYSKMLNFGGGNDDMVLVNEVPGDGLCSGVNHDDPRRGKAKPKKFSFVKKLDNKGGELRVSEQVAAGSLFTTVTTTPKKHKQRTSRNVKVRKEKLGERIGTLQQLVSPFGKSDTATVLHEAVGYIRFLHDQVQVLSFPYLQQNEEKGDLEVLRSKGLCLVPISYIRNVDNGNGADIWLPATNSATRGSRSSS